MDMEMVEFENDLLESVKQMNAGMAARVTNVAISPIAVTRNASGLSQTQFAQVLGVSVRTLRAWEQGQREPSGPAKTLLGIARRHPEVLRELNV